MLILYDIEEATKACANGEDVTFAITDKNRWSIFSFSYYQIKHKTTKEFTHISYQKNKDLLYYLLLLCSKISFGKYQLSYDYK